MADIRLSKRDKARALRRKRYGVFDVGPADLRPSWHYFALFRLLQISQSYWLAHQEQVSRLPPQTPPAEFDKVRHTYELFGSVWDIPFWTWWRGRAHVHFGGNERVLLLSHELADDRRSAEEFASGIERDFGGEHVVNRLLLSIPLTGTRTSVLKQVEVILKANEGYWSKGPTRAAYIILKDKTQKSTVNAAIRAVQARAYFTKSKPLHFIGERSELVPKEWDEINEIALSSIVSRHIRRALLWAENAARGRFLSQDDSMDWEKFDFVGLRDRLETYARVSLEEQAAIPEADRTSEHRYAGRNRTIIR